VLLTNIENSHANRQCFYERPVSCKRRYTDSVQYSICNKSNSGTPGTCFSFNTFVNNLIITHLCGLLLMFLYNRHLYTYMWYITFTTVNMTIRSHVANATYKLPPTIIKVCRFSTFIMFTSYVAHFYYFLNIKDLSIQFKQTSITPGVLKVYHTFSSCIMKW
jgi:hypothetical protein